MKVVFLHDVPNVARAGETKEIADGYGRNFLIPKKLAVLADKASTKTLERQRRIEAKIEADMAGIAQQLTGKEVILKAQTGAQEKLYGSITPADIADELQNATGIAIDKRKIELAEPIRQLGSHEVTIKLAKDITTTITVTVVEKEKGQGDQ
jgi:large subunit ribosomal protein L9